MSAPEELEAVRRRMHALELELAELKARIGALETQWGPAAPAMSAPEVAGGSAISPIPAETTTEAGGLGEPPVLAQPAAANAEQTFAPAEAEPAGAMATPLRAAASPGATRLRDWLEPLQLWPPMGEENAEVRLGAWWATRIGALLAVIGVVFLGVYVSRNTSPWVRLAEVVAVTGGVIVLGSWLERKLPKFGAVVFGAGLALAYFCAFAASAVAPMRVITSPAVAAGLELAVVAAILATAWWRGSQVVATMAVALGEVTAFFALRGGPAGSGPWAVFLLGAAAVALRFARRWDAPSVLAMPLAWLFLLLAALGQRPAVGMSIPVAWGWAVLSFALYFVRDWLGAVRGHALSPLDRAFQVTNAALALAVGWFVTAQVGGARLTEFYFGAGVLMLASTEAWRRTGNERALPAVFACNTAGLFALGVIAAFDGHARSLVLLAQAFVMLVAARHSSIRGLRGATLAAGALALGFFVGELRPEQAPLADTATFVEAVFLVGAMGFVAALQRWLALDAARTALGSVVVGMVGIATAVSWNTRAWSPAVAVALGVALFAAPALLRAWLPAAVAGAMLLIAAHVEMWNFQLPPFANRDLWANEFVLLAAASAAAFGLNRWRDGALKSRTQALLILMAGGTLIAVGFKAFPATLGLAFAAAVSTTLVVVAERARNWPLGACSAPLFALGCVLFVLRGGRGNDLWLWLAALFAWAGPARLVQARLLETIHPPRWRDGSLPFHTLLATAVTLLALVENVPSRLLVPATAAAALAVFALTWRPGLRPALEASWTLWMAAAVQAVARGSHVASWLAFALAWLPALALARPARFGDLSAPPPFWRRFAQAVQTALATMLGLVIAVDHSLPGRSAALGIVLLGAFSAWKWGRVDAARMAVWWITVAGWVNAAALAVSPNVQGWGAGLGAVLGTGAVVALLPFAIDCEGASIRRRLRWGASVGALVLVFYALARQRGTVADYATVGWGVAAVGLFLAGLYGRSRPHRLTGLAGLALCVPRAFLVDLDSTLHRIVAFVALGVVLLWVGFSYHRFRHLIVDEEKKL